MCIKAPRINHELIPSSGSCEVGARTAFASTRAQKVAFQEAEFFFFAKVVFFFAFFASFFREGFVFIFFAFFGGRERLFFFKEACFFQRGLFLFFKGF